MELKEKYKFRLILDEGWSFGVVGKTGRGVTEVFGIPVRVTLLRHGPLLITNAVCRRARSTS